RGAEHCRCGGLAGARLDMDAEVVEVVARLHHDIEQVRYRRPLVAADIRDAGLEQSLGYGENALAVEGFAVTEPQRLDLFSELSFHAIASASALLPYPRCSGSGSLPLCRTRGRGPRRARSRRTARSPRSRRSPSPPGRCAAGRGCP